MIVQHIANNTIRLFLLSMLTIICLSMPARAETIQIESGKMVIFHKNNQAEFSQNVHLTRDTFELFSDRLVTYYNDNDLERAEAFGNIRLFQGDIKGTSDKAILDQKANTLTLIGHAVLIQNGSRLEGDRIIHDISLEKTLVFPLKGGRTHMTIESSDDNKSTSPTDKHQ